MLTRVDPKVQQVTHMLPVTTNPTVQQETDSKQPLLHALFLSEMKNKVQYLNDSDCKASFLPFLLMLHYLCS